MKILSRADEILLMAILRLKDNAYGVTIIKEVKRSTGRELKVGALWVALDILSKRSLIKKRMGDPTPQRGGRRKIYYALTPNGLNELKRIRDLQRELWKGIPETIKDYN